MRKYELALVLTEKIGKDEAKAKQHVDEIISKLKGKITNANVLGMRALAYPITHASQGWYSFMTIELEQGETKTLEKLLELDDQVLRYLLVRAE